MKYCLLNLSLNKKISPEVDSIEKLAKWCTEHGEVIFANVKATMEDWLYMFTEKLDSIGFKDPVGRRIHLNNL